MEMRTNMPLLLCSRWCAFEDIYIDVPTGTIPTPTRTQLARVVRIVRRAQLSPTLLLRIGVETLTFVCILLSNVDILSLAVCNAPPPQERTPGQTAVLNVALSQRPTCSRGSPGVLTMGIETYFIALRALRCQAALL